MLHRKKNERERGREEGRDNKNDKNAFHFNESKHSKTVMYCRKEQVNKATTRIQTFVISRICAIFPNF